MSVEIKTDAVAEIFCPSQVRIETQPLIKYMQNLSAADFQQIRYHCELFTGLSVVRTYFGLPDAEFHEKHKKLYAHFCAELPADFQISEPPCPAIPFVLGTEYGEKVINGSIIRFQICMNYLYHCGLPQLVNSSESKPTH